VLWPARHRPPEILAVTELVWWVTLARLAPRTHVVPAAVSGPRPAAGQEALVDYLGVRIRRSDRCTLVLGARDATRPFLTANEQLWDCFEPGLRRQLDRLEHGAAVRQRVRSVLLTLLPSGRATLDAVAGELSVGARTLQRHLREEGTTFQSVLDGTRKDLAHHYLRDRNLSVPEIAFLLGRHEPRSFSRALRSWTGRTPHETRLALLRGGPRPSRPGAGAGPREPGTRPSPRDRAALP